MLNVPLSSTRNTPFTVFSSPCEQPEPAVNAYSRLPINARSETPLRNPPEMGLVSFEGMPSATVIRFPCESNFEMRLVYPPVYGPHGGGTCWQRSGVVARLPASPSYGA